MTSDLLFDREEFQREKYEPPRRVSKQDQPPVYRKPPQLHSASKVPTSSSAFRGQPCLTEKQWATLADWIDHQSSRDINELVELSRSENVLSAGKLTTQTILEAARLAKVLLNEGEEND